MRQTAPAGRLRPLRTMRIPTAELRQVRDAAPTGWLRSLRTMWSPTSAASSADTLPRDRYARFDSHRTRRESNRRRGNHASCRSCRIGRDGDARDCGQDSERRARSRCAHGDREQPHAQVQQPRIRTGVAAPRVPPTPLEPWRRHRCALRAEPDTPPPQPCWHSQPHAATTTCRLHRRRPPRQRPP